MTQLFPDSETFTRHRPAKLTETQKEAFYLQMAEVIISQNWSDSDAEDIASDLKDLYMGQSGFEMAKDLERGDACYDFTAEFISWLEYLDFEKDRAVNQNIETWVKAHNPQPKYGKQQQLTINEAIGYDSQLKAGQTVYITGFQEHLANYLVVADKDRNGGFIMPYEKVEANCTPQP